MPILSPLFDPMGMAIADFYKTRKKSKISVLSPGFNNDIIATEYLFRDFETMPELEKVALQYTQGTVLDVGSAAGSHALVLQTMGRVVHSIDVSEASVAVQLQRGVANASVIDFFDIEPQHYDTLLFLMNGIGLVGTLAQVPHFLAKCKKLLASDGQIILDSSDIRYLFENEDGSFDIPIGGAYYGEIEYTLRYKNIESKPFSWLYIDFDLLQEFAYDAGFNCEKIFEGEHYDFLARLTNFVRQ